MAESEIIQDVYYHSVLPMALQALGQEGLHASGIRMARGVVAFCAEKGTGKSTIAVAFRQRGYPQWADDTVAFEICNRSVSAIRLPFKVRLRRAVASILGETDPTVTHPTYWDGADATAGELVPLAAVCVLRRAPRLPSDVPVEAKQLSSSQALLAVLPHAHCFGLQDAGRKRRMMRHYLELVAQVPVLEIRMQTGLENLPSILDGVENTVNELLMA
jgi:hypothetical protein